MRQKRAVSHAKAPRVGTDARVLSGPWRGAVGPVTGTFGGGAWVAVRVADHLHPRTFAADEVETVEQVTA